jgi:hypothetical protein
MRVSALSKLAVTTALGAICLGAGLFTESGCKTEEHRRSNPSEGGVAAEDGGPCVAAPGALPTPNCDNSTFDCRDTPGCTIDEQKCGSKKTCLPMSTNKGKPYLDFRFRRLTIATPEALKQDFIQSAIVTSAIDLKARECGELGKGTFSWLLRIDKANKKLITGGAPPATDPFGQGYCFYNQEVNGIKVEPVTVDIEIQDAPDGMSFSWSTKNPQGKLNVPIFLDEAGTAVVILPLTKPRVEKVTVTDSDCIGAFNPIALDSTCANDPSSCSKWYTAGALGGYITIEEADAVDIKETNSSLCVLLTKSPKDPNTNKCKRENGQIPFKGDYCSKTDKPGDCADSFWLAASFAASAAKIYDGAGNPKCLGIPAGTDAGSDAADAGSDGAPGDAASD